MPAAPLFELPLPGPYHNTSGGPTDPYYLVRTGETTYRAHLNDAEACTHVPQSDRLYRTVNVAGVDKWWTTDLSNGGLQVKTGSGTGGAFIGDLGYITITPDMVQSSGAVYVPVPLAATGLIGLSVVQAGRTKSTDVAIKAFMYVPGSGDLRIGSMHHVKAGEVLTGHYYVQESTTPPDPTNPLGLPRLSFPGWKEGDIVLNSDGKPVQEYVPDDDYWETYIADQSLGKPRWTAAVKNLVATMLIQGTNMTITRNVTTGALTFDSATGGGSVVGAALTRQVWVDAVTGDNSTAVVGQQGKPFRDLNSALDATVGTATTIVWMGVGTFASPDPAKLRSNVRIRGAGGTRFNRSVTGAAYPNVAIANPTALVGGTIFLGTFNILPSVTNVQVFDIAVDVGLDYCTLVGSSGMEGFLCAASTSHPSENGLPLRTHMQFSGITVLMKQVNLAAHAFLIEQCIDAVCDLITTWGGFAGFVSKTIGGMYTRIHAYMHRDYGIILKLNEYARNTMNTLLGFIIRGGGGLAIHNESGDNGLGLTNLRISNGEITGCDYGIMQWTGSSFIDDMSVDNVKIDAVTGMGVDFSDLRNSVFRGVRVKGATIGFSISGQGNRICGGSRSASCSSYDMGISSVNAANPLFLSDFTSQSAGGIQVGVNCGSGGGNTALAVSGTFTATTF